MIANFYIGNIATAGGTVDIITASYVPVPTILVDKMLLYFRATGANATTTPTFSPNGLTAHTIVKQGGVALAAGDIPGAGAVMEVCYDEANTRWELINPANKPKYKVYKAFVTQSGTGVPVASVLENNIGIIVWTRNGVGDYRGTLVGAFTANKTLLQVYRETYNNTDLDGEAYNRMRWLSADVIELASVGSGFGSRQDDLLVDTEIEIQVYY